eukprot:gb/GFBE01079130.1/.p1 GENE.gb/GFBE01079130.1/~~gb/GFBE01079130.1/.p1  ORF type:complete len:277 (+),score=15.64 gb/GFBE01079130.1/:1-831(+)
MFDTRVRLDDGATTIMLRNVPTHVTTDDLVRKLDEIAPGSFDFVYVPRDRRRDRNINLAFINLIDPVWAQRVYDAFALEARNTAGTFGAARVAQAQVQGVGRNLAHFMVMNGGLPALDNVHAPQAFQNGVRVPRLRDMVAAHLSSRMLNEVWASSQNKQGRKKPARFNESVASRADRGSSASGHAVSSDMSPPGHSSLQGRPDGQSLRRLPQRQPHGYAFGGPQAQPPHPAVGGSRAAPCEEAQPPNPAVGGSLAVPFQEVETWVCPISGAINYYV